MMLIVYHCSTCWADNLLSYLHSAFYGTTTTAFISFIPLPFTFATLLDIIKFDLCGRAAIWTFNHIITSLFWWSEWESNPLNLCGLPSSGIALTRARPHPLYIYYITLFCFCQEVFEKYLQLFFLFKPYLSLTRLVSVPTPSELVRTILERLRFCLSTVSCFRHLSSPLDIIIISHLWDNVNEYFVTNL